MSTELIADLPDAKKTLTGSIRVLMIPGHKRTFLVKIRGDRISIVANQKFNSFAITCRDKHNFAVMYVRSKMFLRIMNNLIEDLDQI